jgi:hypothetical protein
MGLNRLFQLKQLMVGFRRRLGKIHSKRFDHRNSSSLD